jgi:hypothetical protein
MSVYDKRVTRDMRQTMLKMHNNLKDIKNTIEECNDIWVSDLRRLEEIIHTLHQEFDFKPRDSHGAYWSDWVLAEDVKEEDDDE